MIARGVTAEIQRVSSSGLSANQALVLAIDPSKDPTLKAIYICDECARGMCLSEAMYRYSA